MTSNPVVLQRTNSVLDAARQMRDRNIGDVLVTDGDKCCGLVTDRDIVVRVVAENRDPARTNLDDICSHDVISVRSDAPVNQAVMLMRERAVRRLPVIDNGNAIGVLSIGDLAIEQDERSALADISAAPPNR